MNHEDPFAQLMAGGEAEPDGRAALVEEFDLVAVPRYRAILERWADLSHGDRYEFLFNLREDNLLRQLLEGKVIELGRAPRNMKALRDC